MHGFWLVAISILYFIVCIGGVGLLILGLPGSWVIVGASAVFAWVGHGATIPWAAVIVYTLLSAGAEIFEVAVGAWGTKKYGGSRWAMLGAIIGGIAGAILLGGLFPLIGGIIGAFGGAFAGAFALEYAVNKDFRQAKSSGKGAFLGRLAAVVVKASLAVSMMITSFVLLIT